VRPMCRDLGIEYHDPPFFQVRRVTSPYPNPAVALRAVAGPALPAAHTAPPAVHA